MNALGKLLGAIQLPRMLLVRQHFSAVTLEDPRTSLTQALYHAEMETSVRPGMRIAITAGSRGIDHIANYLKWLGEILRAHGAEPFVVPAMGSHGGATAPGQVLVLEGLGITEESIGMPICASMDTVLMGTTPGGLPAYTDRIASEADEMCIRDRRCRGRISMPSAPYFVQPSGSPISRSLSVSVRKRIQPPSGSPSYQKAKGVTSPVSYTHLDVYKRQPFD